MTGKLEDNLYLAFLFAGIVSGIIHYVGRRPYVLTSACSAVMSALLWMGAIAIESGSVSNIWPIASMIWLILFTPVAFLVGLPIRLLRPKPRLPDHCSKCGYNLTGNVSGLCPECGTGIMVG